MKIKKPRIKIYRIAIQILLLFFLPYLFTLTFDGLRAIFVAIISGEFSFYKFFSKIVNVIAVLPLTIILGRFFCGWMCAFGTVGDMVFLLSSKVFKVKFNINKKMDFYLKFLKYLVLLVSIIFVWWLGYKDLNVLSPWDAFGQLPNFYLAYKEFFVGIMVFWIILFACFFVERFFCRYLCPLGAIFSIASKFRILKIRKTTEKCGKCRICTNNCPMGILLYEHEFIRSGECIECMNCTSVCPRKNAKLFVASKDLNPLIASSIIVATISGIHYGTDYANGIVYANSSASAIISDSNQSISQNKIYKDGTYSGVANGYRPGLTVSVTIKGDKIVKITIGSNNEESGYKEEPFSVIPKRIIDAQSTDVKVVSGATYSSEGIKNAVADALIKASVVVNTIISESPISK